MNASPPAPNYRREVVDRLLPHAARDPRIRLLVADMGFGAIDAFRAAYPDRIMNAGIMEQGAVGIAAGMAMAGLRPVYYCIVNFLAYRAIEQIRNDVALQGLDVKFIGTGANDYFRFLGPSHCCGDADLRMMAEAGIETFDPYAGPPEAFGALVDAWMESPRAGYLRV